MGRLLITKEELIELYLNGTDMDKLMEMSGVCDSYIRKLVRNSGSETRKTGRPRIHSVNEDFFTTWSPQMAYVLGIIATDGCIHNNNSFSIAQKNMNYLLDILRTMGGDSSHKIYLNGNTGCYSLVINSQKMVSDLNLLGITKRKSLIMKFPLMPNEFMPDFIRGVFDGDGHVHRKLYNVTFTSGSKEFSKSLLNILSNIGLNVRLKYSDAYRVIISGKQDVHKFRNYIYNNSSGLFLSRKYKTFYGDGCDCA